MGSENKESLHLHIKLTIDDLIRFAVYANEKNQSRGLTAKMVLEEETPSILKEYSYNNDPFIEYEYEKGTEEVQPRISKSSELFSNLSLIKKKLNTSSKNLDETAGRILTRFLQRQDAKSK